jgi:cytolysin-activating lysine-acyltransferase
MEPYAPARFAGAAVSGEAFMAEKDDTAADKTTSDAQAAQAQPQPGPRQATPRPQRPPAQHILGEVAWLLSQSKTHKHFTMDDLNWFAMPPIMLEQYRIFLGRQSNPENPQQQAEVPMGVAFWAMFSKEVERRFTEAVKSGSGPVQLKPKDWNSGNRLWLIELVAPFATEENQQVKMMMDDFLKNGLLRAFQNAKDNKVKFFQTDKETGERKIVELQAQFSVPQDQPANDGGAAKA